MKKYLLLLLISTSFSYGQTTLANKLRITGNTTDNTATKVNVQATDGTVNTISKVDLQDAFYFASASNFPVTGITDKLYIARDNNILYRFNGTIYVPMSADISGKEDIANKSSSFTASSTVTYANTKALVDGLATKVTSIGISENTIPKMGANNTIVNSRIMDNGFTNNGIKFDFNNVSSERIYLNRLASAVGVEIRASANGLFDQGAVDNNTIVSLTGGLAEGSENYGGFKVLVQDNAGASKLGFFTGGASGNPTLRATIRNNGNLLVGIATDNGQGIIQANGPITANPATLDNQVPTFGQMNTADALKANIASPALTGTPTAPTATVGTNTTQVATTAFVLANSQSIPQLESNAVDLTVWNNGKGNVATNTSFGDGALRVNSTGFNNTAIGNRSLILNTTGTANTSVGNNALQANSTGQSNTSFGASSLTSLSTGNENTALGGSAGATASDISNSVFLGFSAIPLGNIQTNQIVIGHNTTGAGSNTATLGNTSITSTILRGTVSAGNGTASNHLVTKSQVAEQLADFFTDANNTSTTETDLYAYTTLANRLNATGEKLVAVYAGTFNDATASSQIKVVYGGQTIGDTGALTMSVTGAWIVNSSIMRTGATTARAIVSISTPGASTASYTKYTSLTGLTFTGTNILKITGTAGGATGGNDDITASYGNILWQPAAL